MIRISRPLPTWPAILNAALLAVAPGAASRAGDRPRMVDNGSAISAKDCVQTAAQAATKEDLNAFVECFAVSQRRRIRRQFAMVFVTHALSLEVLDSHVVSEQDDTAEIAVKYRLTLSDRSYDIVSIIALVREEGAWRIMREKVESKLLCDRGDGMGSGGGQAFRFGGGVVVDLHPAGDDGLPADVGRRRGGGCANGRCGLSNADARPRAP